VNRVEVGLRGPHGIISGIDPSQVKASVDLSLAANGLNFFRLSQENFGVPLGAEIGKISPPSLEVRLETVKTRAVEVKPRFTGKLPSPLHLSSVAIDPPRISLQGPESTLAKINEVFTEAIDLSTIKGNARISVGLLISPQIRLIPNQPSQVMIDMKIEGSLPPEKNNKK
jgi:YbbR domain-containing protein